MKKKVLALVMAAAMTFGTMGMSTTAFAAAKGQIQVTGTGINDEQGSATVKFGKIVEPNTGSTLGWKFVDDNIAKAFVNGWNGNTDDVNDNVNDNDKDAVITALIALGKLETTTNSNAKQGLINNDPTSGDKFAKALNAVVNTYATTDISNANNLGNGLYVIKAERSGYTYLPMAAYIDTEGNGVDVTAKGSKDTIIKTVDAPGESVEAGEEVTYEVNVPYPYIAGTEAKTFTVSDALVGATFVDSSLKVTVADTEIETGFVVNEGQGYAGKTNMTINFNYDSASAGKPVKITYKAKVDTDLPQDGNVKNTVTSNVEDRPEIKYTVVSDSSEFTVTKLNEDGEKLSGAEFALYRDATEEEIAAKNFETIKVKGERDQVVEKQVVPCGKTSEATEVTGEYKFSGLDAARIYYVKETKAPENYTLNEYAFQLVLQEKEQTETTETKTEGEVKITTTTYDFGNYINQDITDTHISALPSTGGIGTTIFTIGGCVIMIAAAGIFFVSRKKENEAK